MNKRDRPALVPWLMRNAPSDLSSSDRLVMLCLAADTMEDWRCAWPSVSELEDCTGLSRTTVRRCLRSLRQHGLIDWQQNLSSAGYDPNTYLWRVWPPPLAEDEGVPA